MCIWIIPKFELSHLTKNRLIVWLVIEKPYNIFYPSIKFKAYSEIGIYMW